MLENESGVNTTGAPASPEYDRSAWGLPAQPAAEPAPAELTATVDTATDEPPAGDTPAVVDYDSMSDEEIVATAKGQEGSRTVSARLKKYKGERDAATQRAESAEAEADRFKALYEQTIKTLGYDAQDDVPAESNLGHALSEQLGSDAEEFTRNVNATYTLKQQERAAQLQAARDVAQRLASDLLAIKQHFPGIPEVQNATDIRDLGDEYLSLARASVASGNFDPVKCYEATHIDAVLDARMRAAARKQEQDSQSKAHLTPATGKPAKAVAMNPQFESGMRLFHPQITPAELEKAWERQKQFYE